MVPDIGLSSAASQKNSVSRSVNIYIEPTKKGVGIRKEETERRGIGYKWVEERRGRGKESGTGRLMASGLCKRSTGFKSASTSPEYGFPFVEFPQLWLPNST